MLSTKSTKCNCYRYRQVPADLSNVELYANRIDPLKQIGSPILHHIVTLRPICSIKSSGNRPVLCSTHRPSYCWSLVMQLLIHYYRPAPIGPQLSAIQTVGNRKRLAIRSAIQSDQHAAHFANHLR